MSSSIHIVRDYPHAPAKVWRAVTDPDLIPLWTVTGAGARPEGFATAVGTEFQFIARPRPGWSGIVDCVVRESDAPACCATPGPTTAAARPPRSPTTSNRTPAAPASPTTTPASRARAA